MFSNYKLSTGRWYEIDVPRHVPKHAQNMIHNDGEDRWVMDSGNRLHIICSKVESISQRIMCDKIICCQLATANVCLRCKHGQSQHMILSISGLSKQLSYYSRDELPHGFRSV